MTQRVPVWLLVMIGSHPDDLGPDMAMLAAKILADCVGSIPLF